ncbi:hypothetical protein OS493_014564 [Desmophyllum pertusum]|uniref:Uncharacterized protein n=1 Tax=Desmophyllum pertusum TaxID=174260 RepID=A0A9W9YQ34_9CNID|nr:hypothetical protein OS493_014564 [Desmophyllum pertusum]
MRTSWFAFGTLIALISCLTDVSCQRKKCLGPQNYCSGQFGNMQAVCVGGYCVCTGQDYDYNTCLPDAYGCKIVENTDAALAKPQYNNQQQKTNYSCTPVNSSTQYEVHILSVYEAERIHRRPPVANDATVNIVSDGKSDRPIILVLGSYESVNWILNLPADITIIKVILVAYYLAESNVSGDVNQVQVIERKRCCSQWSYGYGSDLGGGNTVGLLKQVYNRYGVVTSFTGTYRADEWSLMLSNSSSQGIETLLMYGIVDQFRY